LLGLVTVVVRFMDVLTNEQRERVLINDDSTYGDIEVFFKMMKHYLNLERETQLRDFDGIIGHVTIVMSRYVFLAFEQCCHDSPHPWLALLPCSEEQQDLSLVEAMQRLLNLALDKVRAAGILAEDTVLAIVYAVMGFAVDMLQTGKRLMHDTNLITVI